jgi:hypothetical protein
VAEIKIILTLISTAIIKKTGRRVRPPVVPKIKCDHPFVYLLTFDNTLSIFGGRVVSPVQKK